jgi:hypothetical protein
MFKNKLLKNNYGSTILMVILIMAVMSILGIAIMNVSVDDNKYAIKEHDIQQAYYIARAGAEATATYLFDNYTSTSSIDSYIAESYDDINNKDIPTIFGGGIFKTSLLKNDSDEYFIQSTGIFNDAQKTVNLGIEELSLFRSAVIVKEDLTISNPNNDLYGSAAIILDDDISDDTAENHIILKSSSTLDQIEEGYYELNSDPFKLMEIPDEVDYLVMADGNILSDINFTHHNNKYFTSPLVDGDPTPLNRLSTNVNINIYNAAEENMILAIYNLRDTTNKNININKVDEFGNDVTDSGSLYLYINSMEAFKGNINVNTAAKVVIIVCSSGGTINLKTGSTESNAYIYAPESDVLLKAGFVVNGSIVAKNVTLESGADVSFSKETGLYPSDFDFGVMSFEITDWYEGDY